MVKNDFSCLGTTGVGLDLKGKSARGLVSLYDDALTNPETDGSVVAYPYSLICTAANSRFNFVSKAFRSILRLRCVSGSTRARSSFSHLKNPLPLP